MHRATQEHKSPGLKLGLFIACEYYIDVLHLAKIQRRNKM